MSRYSNFVNNYCSNKEYGFNSLKLAEFSTNDSTISIIHDKYTLKNDKNNQNWWYNNRKFKLINDNCYINNRTDLLKKRNNFK